MKYVDLFIQRCGYKPDLENPKTLNEKLLLWKNQPPNRFITQITDKCFVKRFIRGKSEAKPIPSIYEGQPEEFLPEQYSGYPFVVKPNNKSNRSRLISNAKDWKRFKEMYAREKDVKYGYAKGEWNYWDIETNFLAEPVLQDFQEYKLMCFHGQLKVIQVLTKRKALNEFRFDAAESLGLSYFWTDGTWIDVRNVKRPPGPKSFDFPTERLQKIAQQLTKGLPFVRLDLLVCPEEVYFGEYSFFIGGGHTVYDPPEFDEILGAFL